MRCDTSCDTCAFFVSQQKTLVYQAFSVAPKNAVTRAISTCHSATADLSTFSPCCDTCDTFSGESSSHMCVHMCTFVDILDIWRFGDLPDDHETLIYGRFLRARGRRTRWSSGTDARGCAGYSGYGSGTKSTYLTSHLYPTSVGGGRRG